MFSGVDAAIGRTLRPDDDQLGANPVAVVSNGYWKQRLHSDTNAVGKVAILNGIAFTIVGVAPPEFFGERVRRPADYWVPLVFQPQIMQRANYSERTDTYWLGLLGRLRPGATRKQAQEASTIALAATCNQQSRLAAYSGKQSEPREKQNSIVRWRRWNFRPSLHLLAAAADFIGRGRAGAAHCMRQRREFIARSRRGAQNRSDGPFGAGREPRAADPSTSYGKRDARGGSALRFGVLLAHWAVQALVKFLAGILAAAYIVERSGAGFHRGRHTSGRNYFRTRAGAAGGTHRPGDRTENGKQSRCAGGQQNLAPRKDWWWANRVVTGASGWRHSFRA